MKKYQNHTHRELLHRRHIERFNNFMSIARIDKREWAYSDHPGYERAIGLAMLYSAEPSSIILYTDPPLDVLEHINDLKEFPAMYHEHRRSNMSRTYGWQRIGTGIRIIHKILMREGYIN